MKSALQIVFLVQVLWETAAEKLSNLSSEVGDRYFVSPLRSKVREFAGTADSTSDTTALQNEINSLRTELHSLRHDVRQLQKSPV